MVTRRRFLGGVLSTLAAVAGSAPRSAPAAVARAVTLGQMLYDSQHVILGTAVDSFARWERVGKRSCIVTYSVFHVEQPLDGRTPEAPELTIRTLGGTVGDLGQTFYGEAVVALKQRAAVFLRAKAPDIYVVTGMAQGHYPVRADDRGIARLHAAFESVELVGDPDGVMVALDGLEVPTVESLIARELGRAQH
jgi:hypothetical protein